MEDPKGSAEQQKKKVTAKKAVKKQSSSDAKVGVVAKQPKSKVRKFGRGKKYLAVLPKVDKNKMYSATEAIQLAQETSPSKFDATVELHIQMGLDPKKPEQNIRGTVSMPAGTGKTRKILVLAEEAEAKKAKAAGADHVGLEEMIKKIQDGWLDFDLVIATPSVMAQVGKLGQTLGTKGLMPNPKSGTVTADPAKAVEEFKKGKVEFRLDKDAIIHLGFGKVSFKSEDLMTNFKAIVSAIQAAKPATSKGAYIKRMSMATTMGPGIKIDLSSI
ncbi:MAG: 50S ribosomal protein L1 [Patescibacteria group bacterium]